MLRNFRYPPSINNESQKSNFKIKFENESKDSKFPYHYGIHYSNSVFIFYFLMRQQPYDNLLIKTQSYNLESPNRMFINLVEFNKLNAESNDNRELIPELFSKIEFLFKSALAKVVSTISSKFLSSFSSVKFFNLIDI